MIKKIFIGGIIITFTLLTNLFVSASFSIQNQELGQIITKDLNFIPNPLNLSSNYPDVLNFKYGRTDDGYIYLAVEEEPGQYSYGSHYGIVRFEYNVPIGTSSPSTPDLSFYQAVRDGTFKPVKFTISGGGGHNSYNLLVFYDKDGNFYQSNCAFFKEGSSINFECGFGNNLYEGISYSVVGSFPNSQFPVNNSPFSLGGGTGGNLTGGIELNSTESALKYFEDYYGWDEKVCYVGIDNVTDLWGSSVSFEEGSGLDIFDTFELLYGNTELTRMYVWMNAWLINYNQWFQNPEDRLYLANYNSGTNQVDLYYDNLTYPFANQPVALYFMADNVSNYTDRQTMASDVVSYCYLKLKGGTYEDIIDNSTKQSIDQYTEKYNTNKGLNPDGTVKNIDYSGFGHYGSGELTGDNSLKGILQRLFGDVDMLKSVPINSNYKILPDWLIISFIFVVLFKILRKK